MDLGDWLRSLGLGQYEAAFRENEIDDTVLPSLTAEDLKDLGVSIVGHRRKLLDAIAASRADANSNAPPSEALPPVGRSTKDAAERRQLTVMFCDLVGSTALSARLDPEDMREIIGAYHRCCAEEIRKASGFVAKYMGDGVLAYFGYPQAHEDDAERAVRGALSLIAAVPALQVSHGGSLQVRIGMATGLVVVGDLIGEGDARERGVVGETPNLAARLQALAQPGQLVISNSTRRLTGGMFEYHDLGRVTLKGLADQVQAWQVTGRSRIESRFEALHETELTPLVGREEELELLLRRWQRAKGGEGQVVLLSGEPGIGKSRLTAELEERLRDEPHTRLRYFCSPHHTDSAFHPVIAQLERAARFERQDTPETKLDKLVSLLGLSSSSDSDLQLLAELLSIPTGDRYRPLNLTPQSKKQKTLVALLRQLQMLCRQRPVLLVYEDAHWIDPSSRELWDMTVERVANLPVLLVITFRPEFQPPWTGQAHVFTLTLGRFGRRDVTALVEHVAGTNALSDEIKAEIVERTDGIPLFVEELTKAVLEAGDADAAKAVSTAPLPALAVPATLHASLMARLDRLGFAAKEVAQAAAAIGREFPFELLAPAAQKAEADLEAALGRLSDAGLVFCRGTPPQATVMFKHALVRDVAYGSLLRIRRQELHARIAQAYQSCIPETARTQPELIAHHFTEAGMVDPAIDYWRRAGDLAIARSANAEAVHHFAAALELIATIGDKSEREARELELCVKLGPALMIVKGTASPEVHAIYTRAAALRTGEDSPERYKSLWGLYYYTMTSGRLREASAYARELLELANRLRADDLVLEGYHARWTTLHWCGDLTAADVECREGISRYDPARHHTLAFAFSGHDPGICAHGIRAINSLLLGFPRQAMKRGAESMTLARSLAHPYSLALAMWHYSIVLQIARQGDLCRSLANELVELSREHNFPMMVGNGMFFTGWASAEAGDLENGIALMEQALSFLISTGRRVTRPYMQAVLARAKADQGKLADASELVDDALSATEAHGECWSEAELHHLRGRLLMARGQFDESEMQLRQAVEISREQSARALELRAATSLAGLWRDQGKRTEARNLLAPIYGWFTEGFGTPDLKEAKALLDELAS